MESKGKNDATKRVKKVKANKKEVRTGKKTKFKDRHPKAATGIKIGLVVLMLLLIIGVGILVGTFFGVFGEELKIDEKDLVIKFKNSTVYDKDGNELATLSEGTKRKIVSMNEMSEYLPKAFVAIEDERFYTHRGVDLKRTAAATFTFITHAGKSSFGGSTITQQLVKNITTDDEDSGLSGVLRKVKEMSKAIQVEQYLSKDQILELYLNIIFVGGDDINGVALGSEYYFDKDVKDLSIAESAYLAAINNSPNAYNPFKDDDKKEDRIKKGSDRTKTVLSKMEELGYITEDQEKEAVAEVDNGLVFKKGDGANVTVEMSYHTAAAIDQIISQILEKNPDWNKDMAELYLYSSGFKIYTTQDTAIQAVLEEELLKEKYVQHRSIKDSKTGKVKETRDAIPTMVIMDQKTGQVVACATATGDKENRTTSTTLGDMNWPTRLTKQTGSSMKPISVIAPGLETGKITPATTYLDCETKFAGMDKSMKNEGAYTNTLMSMREAIRRSQNIPHAKAIMDIGVDVSIEFCKKMGIKDIGNEGVSLALGGLEHGISPTHMAAAYATIANDGEYIEPTFYTKVTDENDQIVLEPEQERNRVLSVQNAYVEKSILTQPVIDGTATYCKMAGIETCAKTGTTNESYDRWLCGFTPYYTAACWYGYEKSTTVTGFGQNPAGQIWSSVMKQIHEDLPNANFEVPDGIVKKTICTVTGDLAVPGQCGSTREEVFAEDTKLENCTGHTTLPICIDTGLISGGPCPTELRSFMGLPERENTTKWTNVNITSFTNAPKEVCVVHGGSAATVPWPAGSTPLTDIQNSTTQTAPAAPAPAQPAPSTPQPAAHTHSYNKTVTTSPTCTAQGLYTYSCTAGDHSYTEDIPALGHNYVDGKCSRCGAAQPGYTPPVTTPPTTPSTDNQGGGQGTTPSTDNQGGSQGTTPTPSGDNSGTNQGGSETPTTPTTPAGTTTESGATQ